MATDSFSSGRTTRDNPDRQVGDDNESNRGSKGQKGGLSARMDMTKQEANEWMKKRADRRAARLARRNAFAKPKPTPAPAKKPAYKPYKPLATRATLGRAAQGYKGGGAVKKTPAKAKAMGYKSGGVVKKRPVKTAPKNYMKKPRR